VASSTVCYCSRLLNPPKKHLSQLITLIYALKQYRSLFEALLCMLAIAQD
jgi:hypothetical protein